MEDSCQDRQENEKAALKAIYNDQLKEVNCSNADWTPLECILTLEAQGSVGPRSPNTPQVDLHVWCSDHYPNEAPLISIDRCKGLSTENSKILLQELKDLACSLKGEVMIFELAQHVENFLHKYSKPGFESFYEEMVKRQRSQLEKELLIKQADEERKREEILMEIQTRQQAVKAEKKALRRRRSSLRTSEECSDSDVSRVSPRHTKPERNSVTECRDVESENLESNLNADKDYTPWNFLSKGLSRFENEFEHIKWLGKGAFGDVLKVRNKLDDGLYAVKRIQLNPMNIQLNKKITREVKLLSRLNHENVVRYYNSWIESALVESAATTEIQESSVKSPNLNSMVVAMLPRKEPSLDWNTKPSESSEESSDECWITFKSASNEDEVDNTSHLELSTYGEDSTINNTIQYMYIQMELCEKSTLRSAIDENLYLDVCRVWRLFREIIEGLCHIHQQGIIHRDLKPVNIFIDNDDHVKIGDFGLATTSIWYKQTAVREEGFLLENHDKVDINNIYSPISQTGDLSQTGQVGTALYVAPELKSRISKQPYNEKVDIFSLGIIFFEMCHPSLQTGMERYKVLTDLRQKDPIFPADFRYGHSSQQHTLIRWMLNYDAKKRPGSQELLQSEHIPPPELEEAEVREMVRHTISNPQSKDYKHLIASCFKQVPSAALDATFDQSTGRSWWYLMFYESVTEKLRKIFWRHGAISLIPPLLTPAIDTSETSVCLMTRGGGIVFATYDLRLSFARYLARNPTITRMKRYALDKVYRERRVHGFHPKEIYDCAFDIVTPPGGDPMPEYELLSVIWEIILEFQSLLRKNCTIHLNHTYLITAMMRHCGLDQEKQKALCLEIYKAKSENRSKAELESHLKSLSIPEHTLLALLNFMDAEGPLNKVSPLLLDTLKDSGLITLCKQGFRHLETVLNYCEIIGITCPVIITLGQMQNANYFSGVTCQVVLEQRTKQKHVEHNTILSGGRYDVLLQAYRKSLPVVPDVVTQSVTGFVLSVDKLINALNDEEKPSAVDVLICSLGQSQMTADKLALMRDLWRSGIRTSYLSTMQSLEDIKTYCQELNIMNIVTLKDTETGFARVGGWVKERFQEKKVSYNDLVDHLNRSIKTVNHIEVSQVKCEVKLSSSQTESSVIVFIDKPTPAAKRRFENQIWNCLSNTLQRFSNRVRIDIFALTLEKDILKKLWLCFESGSKDHDLNLLRDEHPRQKRYINKVIERVEHCKSDHSSVVILYSLPDNMFKTLV